MARTAHTVKTNKAKKPRGRKQLNASLPEQLVLDFNKTASEEGRDELLEHVLLSFLERVRPDSKSVRKLSGERVREPRMSQRDAERLSQTMDYREAVLQSRDHALQIVKVTTDTILRKGPKRAAQSPKRRNVGRAS